LKHSSSSQILNAESPHKKIHLKYAAQSPIVKTQSGAMTTMAEGKRFWFNDNLKV
jgi:hypothetical protein